MDRPYPGRRVCVFCGARPGARPAYLAAADALVDACAGRGLGIVYGGASVGLMGRVADRALAAGLEVVGVIPQGLVDREVAHGGAVDLRVVATMHERKALMAAESDAFVALPGGIGTYEELFEVFTWSALGLHAEPMGLLDAEGFFAPLAALLDHTVAEGFLDAAVRDRLRREEDPEALLDALLGPRAPGPG